MRKLIKFGFCFVSVLMFANAAVAGQTVRFEFDLEKGDEGYATYSQVGQDYTKSTGYNLSCKVSKDSEFVTIYLVQPADAEKDKTYRFLSMSTGSSMSVGVAFKYPKHTDKIFGVAAFGHASGYCDVTFK